MRLVLALAAALFASSMDAAKAALVTVDGETYDVTTILGSFNDNEALLTSQVWWGDSVVAESFALAVGDSLGLPGNGIIGPTFAHRQDMDGPGDDLFGIAVLALGDRFISISAGANPGDDTTYAIATVAAVPLPAGFGLLGAALIGLGLMRRRKSAA